MSVFEELCVRIQEIVPQYEKTMGQLEYLNVGGGLGVNYDQPDEDLIADFKGR